MDRYRVDSHKLIYHPARVAEWLAGENIYPVYMEIAPAGGCNHRCTFCALDYLHYQARFLDKDVLKGFVSEAAGLGVKSIMYAGEGEPLLHRDIGELIVHTKSAGIDAAVTTNGVLFREELAEEILGFLSWIKVSLDAGTAGTYAGIHRCAPEDFDGVIGNLASAVKVREKNGYSAAIGVQFLLIPENCEEVVTLASTLKDTGVDYLIVKPFSRHPLSESTIDENFDYNDYLYLEDELQKFADDDFEIIFRIRTMKKLDDGQRYYEHCLGLPFFSCIDSAGDVYACNMFLGNPEFCYGNIYKNSLAEIWEGEKRAKVMDRIGGLDADQCRVNCRLDEINRYLWDLKNPPPHSNFI